MSDKDYVSLSIAAPELGPKPTPIWAEPPGSPTLTSTPSSGARKTKPALASARGLVALSFLPQPPTHPPAILARTATCARS